MAIPAQTVRFVFSGTAPGSEIFATGFWTAGGGTLSDEASLHAAIIDLQTSTGYASFLTQAKALIAPDTAYTKLTAYYYPTGGPTAGVVAEEPISAGVGSSGAGSVGCMQQCMVASLRTAFAGRRKRGRMYLPATGAALTVHRFDNTRCDNVAAAVSALLNHVNTAGTYGQAAVVSQTGSSSAPITVVTVDNKPDIQRRHANKFAADHVGSFGV